MTLSRLYLAAAVAVTAIVCRELGRALIDLADAMDPGCDDSPTRCPAYVPDALVSRR